MSPLILIGGGGHAKVLVDCIEGQGGTIAGYVDPRASAWLDALNVPHISEDKLPAASAMAMGFVGLDCASLEGRYRKMRAYIAKGATFPAIIHPSAIVSKKATIGAGVQVFPGAVVNAYATVEAGAIINSNAIVEHDAHIGTGVHVAPGASVLGGAKVAEFSYIGSNAVIVQLSEILPCTFVKSLALHK